MNTGSLEERSLGAEAARTEELERSGSLAAHFARMAHEFEPLPVDAVLRGLDIAVALTALILTSPLLIVIALAVRLTSGSPVLYRGARVGRAGQIFTMFKFRTLRPDAEVRLSPLVRRGADPPDRARGHARRTGPPGDSLRRAASALQRPQG